MTATRRNKESYICLRAKGGFNDCILQLAVCTQYAIRHKRSIVLELNAYNDTENVFDFSEYPVKVYTNLNKKLQDLKDRSFYPVFPKEFTRKKTIRHQSPPVRFNLSKSYPPEVVLMYSAGVGGLPIYKNSSNREIHIFEHLRFTKEFLDKYKKAVHDAKIPEEYIAIHLRATDMPLKINSRTKGLTAEEIRTINTVKKSGNSHKDALVKVSAFIEMNPETPVYIASDNIRLLKKLKEKHSNILTTESAKNNECESNRACKRLHKHNSDDSSVLSNALIDLLLLANAKKLMISNGGFSRLAADLFDKKDLLKKLLHLSS
jgi:hypothetical protein